MLLRVIFLIGVSTLAAASSALAEWSILSEGILYYTNDFFALGFDAELMPHLVLEVVFHYERTNFTTGILEDERNGGHENIFLETGGSSTN